MRWYLLFILLLIVGCSTEIEVVEVHMKLTSNAFLEGESIPRKFTCDGNNINPSLLIKDVPEGVASFALIMDDPDVPAAVRESQMWDHWILYNIRGDVRQIDEGSSPGVKGQGSYDHMNYGGPCPPPEHEPTTHRYFFKLYALDKMLDLDEGATKSAVMDAMQGHIVNETVLMGTYDRS